MNDCVPVMRLSVAMLHLSVCLCVYVKERERERELCKMELIDNSVCNMGLARAVQLIF